MSKIKKNVKKYSRLAIKKGTEIGKKIIKTKLIIVGIILLVITVGIIGLLNIIPFMIIVGNGDGDYTIPDQIPDPIIPVPIAPTLNQIIPNTDTDGDIIISWNQVSGATKYNIYRKVAGGSYTRIARISGTSYTDYDLTDGNYYYKVRATNIEGSSPNSNIVSVVITIPITLPPLPPPLQVVIPSTPVLDPFVPNVDIDGIVTLTWTAITDAQSYKIYRSKDGGIYEVLNTVNTNSYTDIDLEDGIYIYKIKASNNAGDSVASNIQVVKVQIPTATPPTATLPSGTNQTTIIVILVVVVIIGISVVVIIQKFSKKKITN